MKRFAILALLSVLAACAKPPTNDATIGTRVGAGFPSEVPLSSLARSGATTNQVATWNDAGWSPQTLSVLAGRNCDAGQPFVGGDGGSSCSTALLIPTRPGNGPIGVETAVIFGSPSTPGIVQGMITVPGGVQTTTATPDTSMSISGLEGFFGNAGLAFTVIVTGHEEPGSAQTFVSETWTGSVVTTSSTCAIASTGGAFAAVQTSSNGTVAATPISVSLSGCNLIVQVTGITSTTWDWTSSIQIAAAGGI